jgi:hypothetical protein
MKNSSTIINQLKAAIRKRMKENPILSLANGMYLPARFKIAEATIAGIPCLRVGEKDILLPVPHEVRLPADYSGPIRVAILSDGRLNESFAAVGKALGIAEQSLRFHEVALTIDQAVLLGVTAATSSLFMDWTAQGEFSALESAVPRPANPPDPDFIPTAEMMELIDKIDQYGDQVPPAEDFRKLTRLIGERPGATTSLARAHLDVHFSNDTLAGWPCLAIDDTILMVPHSALPSSAFFPKESEAEWRQILPGIAKVWKCTDPVQTMLSVGIPDLGLSEFVPTECLSRWSAAFEMALRCYVMDRDMKRTLMENSD